MYLVPQQKSFIQNVKAVKFSFSRAESNCHFFRKPMKFAHCSFLDTRQSNELDAHHDLKWLRFCEAEKLGSHFYLLADDFNQSFAVDCRGPGEFDTVQFHGFDGLYLTRRLFWWVRWAWKGLFLGGRAVFSSRDFY